MVGDDRQAAGNAGEDDHLLPFSALRSHPVDLRHVIGPGIVVRAHRFAPLIRRFSVRPALLREELPELAGPRLASPHPPGVNSDPGPLSLGGVNWMTLVATIAVPIFAVGTTAWVTIRGKVIDARSRQADRAQERTLSYQERTWEARRAAL